MRGPGAVATQNSLPSGSASTVHGTSRCPMSAGDRKYYETLSQSPLLFPPEDISQANLHLYKALSESEYQTYAQLFSDVVNGA